MKLLDRLLGKKVKGSPCWVFAKESNVIKLVKGLITTNLDDAVEIEYEWIDKTEHTFFSGQDEYIAIIRNKPVFQHNVGNCFTDNRKSKIGSEYQNKIIKSDIGSQMIETLEEYREGTGIPWRWILIIGGILILGIVLWQTGILQSLFGSVTESVVPATKPVP